MSIAKILVPLTGQVRDRIALNTAIAVARPFNAHITALFVHLDPKFAFPYSGVPLLPQDIEDVLTTAENTAAHAEKAAKDTVNSVIEEEGILLAEPSGNRTSVTCTMKSVTGLFREDVLKAAELSDLIVFGPVNTDDEPEVTETFLDALLRTERPLLIAPEPPARLAQVAIGWDGSGVAAHAVQAALPLLKRAGQVDVLTIRTARRGAATDDLQEYLTLHDVPASYREVRKCDQTIAESLLKAAVLSGADLLVIGGYGHGYWRETLFGGVTAHVRWHATLPVLMVH